MSNLSVKYRPTTFAEVCSQASIIKILEQQLATNQVKNALLFYGPSGCGKTTLARILAYEINKYQDAAGNWCSSEPIEMDAASHNSVEDARWISESAKARSLDGKYKIFIIDEAHQLSTQAWNSLLKTIEETPEYTIFIFCTTEYKKVPETIKNRCQQYQLTTVSDELISKRLKYICSQEGYTATDEAIQYITKLAQGSARHAISLLEKCKDYSTNITIESALKVLGEFSYDIFFKLTNALIDKNKPDIISIIENLYSQGNDLKAFIDMYIDFVLDLTKYIIFRSFDIIKIPISYKEQIEYTINVETAGQYYNHLVDKILDIKYILKDESNIKSALEIKLLQL